jgi:hypothetical protein
MKKENVNTVLGLGLSRRKGQTNIRQQIKHYPLLRILDCHLRPSQV